MTVHLTAVELLAAVGVPVVLLGVWRASARRARAAAQAARSGVRALSLAGRVVALAGAMVGVQWLVLTRPGVSGWAVLTVLGLPALLASFTLTRALTVTTTELPRRRDGGHR